MRIRSLLVLFLVAANSCLLPVQTVPNTPEQESKSVNDSSGQSVNPVNATKDNTNTSNTSSVSNKTEVKSVTLNQNTLSLTIGQKSNISAEVNLSDNSKNNSVQWESSEPGIATVNTDGTITALKEGSAIIKAISTQDNSKFAECKVTVTEEKKAEVLPVAVNFLNVNNNVIILKPGENLKFEANVTYSDGKTDNNIKWKTSDENTTTIINDGTLTALKNGKVTVTASSTLKPDINASLVVNIESPPVQTIISSSEESVHSPLVDIMSLKNETVVFNSENYGLKDIYVFNGDSSNLRKLTLPFGKVEQASMSFTGNNIIFVGDGAVHSVNIDGNNLIHIRNGNLYYPVYSNDVKNILYTARTGGINQIATSAFHGSNYKNITDSGNDRDASYSPDATKIVYVEGNTKIKTADSSNGNNRVQIYSSGKEISFPTWSPDGKLIAFIQKDDATTYNLYTMKPDGTNIINHTNYNLGSGLFVNRIIKWSQDSGKIFFSSNFAGEGVYVVTSDASCAITKIPLNFAGASVNGSLTGKLLYVTDKGGTNNTYLKTFDTNQEIKISTTGARGGKIFYNRNYLMFAGNDGIYWTPDNSTVMTKIPNTTGDSVYPEWIPDGRILFNMNGGGTVYLSTLDGSSIMGVPLGNPQNGHFEMSPDEGSKVVYTSVKSGETIRHIYSMKSDTSNKQQLTNTGNNSSPVWSPDAKKIAFDSDRTGQKEIFVMNTDGTSQTALTNFGAYEPKWSPDGKKIAFTTEKDGKKSIYVMNSDGTGVEKLLGDNLNNYYLIHWK